MEATLDENRSHRCRKAESHGNDVRMPNPNYNKQGDTQQDIAEQHSEPEACEREESHRPNSVASKPGEGHVGSEVQSILPVERLHHTEEAQETGGDA